jgi:HK97 family phage prohead protease
MSVAILTRASSDIQTRLQAPDPRAVAAPKSYDATTRTVEAIVATDNPIKRFGVAEVLLMSTAAADLSRAAGGRMAFLMNHDPDRPIGTVETVAIRGGQLVATLRFADTAEGRKAEGQVARNELTQFSIGYRVHSWSSPNKGDVAETWRAAGWELLEVSLVSIPADKAAIVRNLKGLQTMPTDNETIERDERVDQPTPAPPSAAATAAQRAERQRASTIADIGRRAGLDQLAIDQAVENGTTVDAFRTAAIDHLAARHAPASHVRIERDEGDTRIRDMSAELMRRMAGEPAPRSQSAQRYMGLSLVEMAAETIGHRGRIGHAAADREQILKRAFHTTSDFPQMFETATNGRMAERYVNAQATYRTLCRRRDVSDFRPAPHYRPGDLPALERLAEGGKITFGTLSESREYLMVAPYARALAFTRQMLVNDDYGAIDDVLRSYGERVIAFEERLFWTMVLSASGAGPTLQTTTRALFNTTDGSLAGAAAAITVASVSIGRAAMRKQKSLDGLFVQAEPRFIVAGADKETEVDLLLTEIRASEVAQANPFAGVLNKVITPEITGNAWYLFADPARVPAFIYSLLDGYQAPRLTLNSPFETQGLQAKVEHDVGFSGVDFRGAYRNAGS